MKKSLVFAAAAMIAAGIGITTTGILHFRCSAARESYLSSTTIAKAVSAYERYNLLNRARNSAALATGGVWVYSFLDALLSAPNQPGLRLSYQPTAAHSELVPTLGIRVHF